MPGIGVASNKDRFADIFKLLLENHSDDFDFIPKTFCLPKEIDKLKTHMNKHQNKTFIFKPTEGAEGCGILLAQKFKDIPKIALNTPYVA